MYLSQLPIDLDFIIRNALFVLVLLSEMFTIWRGEYGKRDAYAIALFVLAAVGFIMLRKYGYLYDTLLIFAARNEDFSRLIKLCGIALIASTVGILLCVAFGSIENVTKVLNGRTRQFLGFLYSLYPAQILLSITCIVCWLGNRKTPWTVLILLLVANIAVFLATISRASFFLSLVVLLFAALCKYIESNKFWNLLSMLAEGSFIAAFAITGIVVLAYSMRNGSDATVLDGINTVLLGRIQLSVDGINDFGIRPFGQLVNWIGSGMDSFGHWGSGRYNYVDNLYLHSLIERGIVYTAVFVGLHTVAACKAMKRHDRMMSVVLLVLAVHFLVDDLSLGLWFNPFLFVMGSYINMTHAPSRISPSAQASWWSAKNSEPATRGKHARIVVSSDKGPSLPRPENKR